MLCWSGELRIFFRRKSASSGHLRPRQKFFRLFPGPSDAHRAPSPGNAEFGIVRAVRALYHAHNHPRARPGKHDYAFYARVVTRAAPGSCRPSGRPEAAFAAHATRRALVWTSGEDACMIADG